MEARKRVYGCKRDLRDPRDHKFKIARGRVPAVVDLRQHCPPIMDQGDIGSCTAQAITAVLRWHVVRHGSPDKPLSRLQLYYDERKIENTILEDAGAEIRTGIKVAKKIGVGSEALWPYVESNFTIAPPSHVYDMANMFGGLTYERVDVSAWALKKALATKGPVVIGVTLFESFESEQVERDGMVPVPNVDTETMVGGHAMYAVGYGQRPGHFTVANSWGESWGDRGFCYIPEKILGSTEFGGDYWVASFEGGF